MKCFVVLSALLCVAVAELGYPRGGPIGASTRFSDAVVTDAAGSNDARFGGYADSSDFNGYPGGRASLPEDESGAIPGRAGIDYPIYDKVPQTSFKCEDHEYPGYYADTEAQCQAFHICERNNRKHSFLCPNGTIFNQQVLVCDWWNSADCSRSEEFYSINEQIVREMEAAEQRLAEERARKEGGYDYTPANSNNSPSTQYGAPNGKSNGNNFGEYPAASGSAPSSQYGAPNAQASSLSSQYGAPARSNGNNGAASNQYDVVSGRGKSASSRGAGARGNTAAPSSQYGAPAASNARGSFTSPSSQYGAPARGNTGSASTQYGAPSASSSRGNFAAPSNQYNNQARGNSAAPSNQYGTPARGNFGSASTEYGVPSASNARGNFAAPSNQYGAPAARGNFGSASTNSFSSPSSEYGAPSQTSNSYLPPSK